jgi:type III pantothenate kinase
MLLVIDVGNTSISCGIFSDNTLIKKFILTSDKSRSIDEYGAIIKSILNENNIDLNKIKNGIIASVVVPLTETIKNAVEKYLNIECLKLTYKINTDIIYKTDNPKELGADRIANARAVKELYPNQNCVVVDFGTATNFDVISKNGEFLGGIIAPGIGISAQALNNCTSLLPKVRIENPKQTIGKNTIDAILSGLVYGQARMIDGLLQDIENELGEKIIAVATGGYSELLSGCIKRKFDYIVPDLTLIGLKYIFYSNKTILEKSSIF